MNDEEKRAEIEVMKREIAAAEEDMRDPTYRPYYLVLWNNIQDYLARIAMLERSLND